MITLLFSVMALTASAAEEQTSDKSGKCGENLTYSIDGEGVLTVSGTGMMDDWSLGYEYAPWYASPLASVPRR